MNNKHNSREAWLMAALVPIKRHFSAYNYTVPPLRVACGWPSKSALGTKKRRLGEAWVAEAAADGVVQLFVSPCLADPDAVVRGDNGVLSVLVHEVCHAVVGVAEGHNKVFGKCARAVGLEGKLTSTVPGEKLQAEIGAWLSELGPYPHSKLDLLRVPKEKKQTTRMIKMECGQCGYTARTTRKWLDEVGAAHCPAHGEMSVEEKSDEPEMD